MEGLPSIEKLACLSQVLLSGVAKVLFLGATFLVTTDKLQMFIAAPGADVLSSFLFS